MYNQKKKKKKETETAKIRQNLPEILVTKPTSFCERKSGFPQLFANGNQGNTMKSHRGM